MPFTSVLHSNRWFFVEHALLRAYGLDDGLGEGLRGVGGGGGWRSVGARLKLYLPLFMSKLFLVSLNISVRNECEWQESFNGNRMAKLK